MTISDLCIALSLLWDGLGKCGTAASIFGAGYALYQVWFAKPSFEAERDEWYRAWVGGDR